MASAAMCGLWPSLAFADVQPFRSQRYLPSSNGRSSIAFDAQTGKLTHFFENPYRFPKSGTESRNFAYDAYPGIRIGGVGSAGTWLNGLTPSLIEYVPGTGVVHVRRSTGGLDLDEYHFTPMGLSEHAAFMLLEVTRTGGSGAIDAYALYNFHLGAGSPMPSPNGEETVFTPSRDAFYEYGPAGLTFAYGNIGASTKHAATPQNPYDALLAGQDLANNAGTTSPTNDVAVGFQSSMGALAIGASAWAGWYVTTGLDSDVQPVVDRVRTWIGSRTPDVILADEIAAWAAWRKPVPAGLSPLESSVYAQSQAVLRMGQVSAPGTKADGQILASLPPSNWNISWVRDTAYATSALARLGHVDEAKRAIRFQLGATANQYADYVGKPYAISVVRYFGEGLEESDFNQDGPNIEFDGFGLFLWELEETVRAKNDAAFLAEVLPRVKSEIGDVLIALQDPNTGLISKDSSIWEVHWNGKEENFAYTTITAAKGLCALASMIEMSGDRHSSSTYRAAGKKAQAAIMNYLRAPNGTIVQSTQALARGSDFLDAAAVEAMNFGLVHPKGRSARATLESMRASLVPPSQRGFFRNQKGGWYDSQESIFVDLRTARSLDLLGDVNAAPLLSWNVSQAAENFGLFAELHDRVTADYRGEAPMIGFGAGAYMLALLDRGQPVSPACGEFVDSPEDLPDADGGPLPDGGPPNRTKDGGGPDTDNGGAPGAESSDSGCSCGVANARTRHMSLGVMGLAALAFVSSLVRRVRRAGKRRHER